MKKIKYLIVGLMMLLLASCSSVNLPEVPQVEKTVEVSAEYVALQSTMEALQEQIENQEPVTIIEYVEVTPTTDARVLPTAVIEPTPTIIVEDCPANNWPRNAVALIPKWEVYSDNPGLITFSFDCEKVHGTLNTRRGIFNIFAELAEDGMSMKGYMESIDGGEQRSIYLKLSDRMSGKFRGSFYFKDDVQAFCGGVNYSALPTKQTCKVTP